MRFLFFLVLVVGVALPTALGLPAVGVASAQSVVAVVNDLPITEQDLSLRVRMGIVASGLSDTPAVRADLQRRVLEQLIEERIQKETAQDLGITILPQQVNGALTEIARRNQLSAEAFTLQLESQGVPAQILRDSLEVQLLWNEVIRQRYVPEATVSESSVEEYLSRALNEENEPAYWLAEIFLPVVSSSDLPEARQAAERLRSSALSGEATFDDLARQFSSSVTASVGGEIGWVRESNLSPARHAALQGLFAGDITEPLRERNGLSLLLLRESRREEAKTIHLVRLAWTVNVEEEEINEALSNIHNCRAARNFAARQAEQEGASPLSANLGAIRRADLSTNIQAAIRDATAGVPTLPARQQDGTTLAYVLCPPDKGSAEWQAAHNTLVNEQLNSIVRNALRRLRRVAQISIRETASE